MKRKGYTLVEILMGVFIMAIGLVSILGAFPVGMRIVQKIKRTTILCNFAVSKLAEYQAYASPMTTLCYGETAGEPANPHVVVLPDIMHATPGIEGTNSAYGISALAPNGDPGTAPNGTLDIVGAGKKLHYKMSDFETYVRGPGAVYDINIDERDWNRLRDKDYHMGFTQNQRRYREGYGFTRKYILEVWEDTRADTSTDSNTKTDIGYSPANDMIGAYYAFSTAIWNPHVFHSTEWSPIMDRQKYASPTCQGQHNYFWQWNNYWEGWGFLDENHSGGGNGVTDDKMLVPPTSPEGDAEDYPWM